MAIGGLLNPVSEMLIFCWILIALISYFILLFKYKDKKDRLEHISLKLNDMSGYYDIFLDTFRKPHTLRDHYRILVVAFALVFLSGYVKGYTTASERQTYELLLDPLRVIVAEYDDLVVTKPCDTTRCIIMSSIFVEQLKRDKPLLLSYYRFTNKPIVK